MPIIKDYLSPLVEKCFNIKQLFKNFIGVFPIMLHGISPHKNAENPPHDLPNIKVPDDDKNIFQATVSEIYKEANDRIEKLEEKAFKLLTYISALSALVLYFLSNVDASSSKILIAISIFLLFIAILLSLRCIGTKTRKSIFIDSIFNFNITPPTLKNGNEISKSYLESAVYNQAVADNTADILKASRYFLTFAFLVAFLGFFINLFEMDFSNKEAKEIIIVFKDSTTFQEITSSLTDVSERLDSAIIIGHKLLLTLDSIN